MATVKIKRVIETVHEFPDLGRRIKQARKADDRTLAEICRTAEISRSYWYQLEEEDLRSPVNESMIRRVEAVLGIDLGVVFND